MAVMLGMEEFVPGGAGRPPARSTSPGRLCPPLIAGTLAGDAMTSSVLIAHRPFASASIPPKLLHQLGRQDDLLRGRIDSVVDFRVVGMRPRDLGFVPIPS